MEENKGNCWYKAVFSVILDSTETTVMKQFLEDQTRTLLEYSTRDKSSSSECP